MQVIVNKIKIKIRINHKMKKILTIETVYKIQILVNKIFPNFNLIPHKTHNQQIHFLILTKIKIY